MYVVDGMGVLLTSSWFVGCGVAVCVADVRPLSFPSYRFLGRHYMVSWEEWPAAVFAVYSSAHRPLHEFPSQGASNVPLQIKGQVQ